MQLNLNHKKNNLTIPIKIIRLFLILVVLFSFILLIFALSYAGKTKHHEWRVNRLKA